MSLRNDIDQQPIQNERQITIQYRMDDHFMWVRSRLRDDHHDFFLYWKIDLSTHKVVEMEGIMNEKPFDECPDSLRIIERIVGLEISVGVKKSFRKLFPKQEGCTHITELSLATFDFIIARIYGPKSGKYSEEERGRRMGQIANFLCQNNTCTIFNQTNLPRFDACGKYRGKDYDY